jgi:hypothetical protein
VSLALWHSKVLPLGRTELHANSKPVLETTARDRLSSLITIASVTTKKFYRIDTSGLYYKHIKIINYYSSVVKKFGALLTDDARVVIYDCHILIVQATVVNVIKPFFFITDEEAEKARVFVPGKLAQPGLMLTWARAYLNREGT